jgi:hypothetical protein
MCADMADGATCLYSIKIQVMPQAIVFAKCVKVIYLFLGGI